MAISSNLSRIDYILSRLNTHPEYSPCLRQETNRAIFAEAAAHSVQMELQISHKIPKRQTNNEGLKDLEVAYRYLVENGITLSTLSRLGNLVDPKGHPYESFRVAEVTFGEFNGAPKHVLYERIDGLIWNLDNLPLHPVTRAIEAHIGLVNIHPYEDGNGRSARLLEAFCLAQKGIPPPVIREGDKKDYIALMNGALKDRRERGSYILGQADGEKRFNSYIEGKIIDSLDHLKGVLDSKRSYSIVLGDVTDQGIAHAVVGILKTSASSRNNEIKISLQREKGGKYNLDLTGDISREEIAQQLGRASGKYGIRAGFYSK